LLSKHLEELPLEVVNRNNFAAEFYHLKVEDLIFRVFANDGETEVGGLFWCRRKAHA